jgi:uncharacterized membrane protein YphA (DoxX/SURF4 family)
MNVILWVLQALLAAMFAMSGLSKAAQPLDELAGKYPWMRDVSPATVRLIGALEMLGAIGLIVPAAVQVAPVLTPIAATALAVMMISAAAMHIRRKEPSSVRITAILVVFTTLVAWGRFGPYSW